MNTSSATLKFEKLVKRPLLSRSYSPSSQMRILQVFLNADLRGSHNSLIVLGKAHGLDLVNLAQGQAVVFINKRRTLMKIYVTGNSFSFTRRGFIDLEAIKHLPKSFGANEDFDYDRALAISLEERLGRKQKEPRH